METPDERYSGSAGHEDPAESGFVHARVGAAFECAADGRVGNSILNPNPNSNTNHNHNSNPKVEGSLCRHALGLFLEKLPGAYEWNIDASVRQLEVIEKKGLSSYLKLDGNNKADWKDGFRDFEPALRRMMDDALGELGQEFCITRKPTFKCSCGLDRVWRTLALLSKEDIKEVVEGLEDVEVKCEFCYKSYVVTRNEVRQRLLQ